MKAFGHTRTTRIDDADAIVELDVPDPVPGAHDLLVEVRAVSVNPVDWKVRSGLAPDGPHRILGWDAAGIVRSVGEAGARFRPGDRVFYAGELTRPGSNAQLQVVDERIAGRMPESVGFAEAAALPLTAITAWETILDRLGVPEGGGEGERLLIVGAAGGVGSIAIQLARALTRLEVIATASRPETAEWVRGLGAHAIVDHSADLAAQLRDLAPDGVDHIFSTNGTDGHFPALVEAARAEGGIALIDDPANLDVTLLKRKSLSLHWEFMFTRTLYGTAGRARQGALLDRVAALVDTGTIRTTLSEPPAPLTRAALIEAHRRLEAGRVRGKLALVA